MLKKVVFILFIACLFKVNLYAQDNSSLRIMSYNLRFGELASLKELGEFIKSCNPDVVLLQEVDIYTHREIAPAQNGKNFIAELGYYTGMMSIFGKSIDYKGGYYGLGILSKYPIVSMERFFLPMLEKNSEQRSLLLSRIDLGKDKQITVACTHLDLKSDTRIVQVDSINKILLKEKNPVIVAGDFNAKPASVEISQGMADWLRVCNDDFTVSAKAPRSKIDYIFCYPKESWVPLRAETPRVELSDHLPIIADIRLKE